MQLMRGVMVFTGIAGFAAGFTVGVAVMVIVRVLT